MEPLTSLLLTGRGGGTGTAPGGVIEEVHAILHLCTGEMQDSMDLLYHAAVLQPGEKVIFVDAVAPAFISLCLRR